MALYSDIQNILELSNKSSSAQSEAFEKLKRLQEKIRGGDSTGDKIRDFVIANLRTLSPEAEKPYRETEARLKNGVGSQILVVNQSESIHGCPGIVAPAYINPMFIGIDTELKLGVLTSGLELDVKEGNIILPTDKHAIKYDRYSRSKWKLEEGPISFSWYEFANLGKEVQRRMTPMPNDLSAHFEHGLTLHLREEVEQYFGVNRHLDTSYVEALNLLGHEAPERFRKKYDEEVYQTRVGVINKLEELTGREAKLNSEIESIYGSMKHGGFMRGGALTMVEDEDDARVVSMGPRMKLKETREEIQRYLKQGIELCMHTGNLKIEQKPGMEINVPAYISGMCEKYQVEIPN
jgi:hypothetical protein